MLSASASSSSSSASSSSSSSSLLVLLSLLDDVESTLDGRINAVADVNDRYIELLTYLRRCRRQEADDVIDATADATDDGAKGHIDDNDSNMVNNSETNNSNSSNLESNSLEHILGIAKKLREGKEKVKDKGTKAKEQRSKQEDKDSITTNSSSKLKPSGSIGASKYYEDVYKQLDEIGRQNVRTSNTYIGIDKDLYKSQSMVLSRIHRRPHFTKSQCYSIVQGSFQDSDTVLPRLVKEGGHLNEVLRKLTTMVRSQQGLFDKKLKSKLARILTNEQLIHKDDKMDIIENWYRCHRFIETYELLSSSSSSAAAATATASFDHSRQPINDENLMLLKDLISCMPICTPLQVVKGGGSSKETDEWLRASIDSIEEFHSTLQSRYQYVVESSIGKHQLKDTISSLKVCSQMETDGSSKGSTSDRWIKSLKAYKALYSCLVTQAQHSTDCLFVSKS